MNSKRKRNLSNDSDGSKISAFCMEMSLSKWGVVTNQSGVHVVTVLVNGAGLLIQGRSFSRWGGVNDSRGGAIREGGWLLGGGAIYGVILSLPRTVRVRPNCFYLNGCGDYNPKAVVSAGFYQTPVIDPKMTTDWGLKRGDGYQLILNILSVMSYMMSITGHPCSIPFRFPCMLLLSFHSPLNRSPSRIHPLDTAGVETTALEPSPTRNAPD